MVTTTGVDGIIAAFPKSTIPPIHGEPDRITLIAMHKLLCANAASITTNLGGGNHGHLSLLMTAAEYLEETQKIFTPPTNPGEDPTTTKDPNDQASENDRFKRHVRVFEKYQNTDKALKQQIEETIESDYLSSLHNELTGYSRVTSLQMLQHLYKTYGRIDDTDIEKNNEKMMTAYDPELPIAKLTIQLENGRKFAHLGKQTITESMMISKGITLLRNTGVFHDDIKEWRRRPDTEKTWDAFKIHFQMAHQERRTQMTTAGNGGYNAAANNIYGELPPDPIQELQERAAESLETISDGLSSHQDSISELTQANAVLSNTNTTMAAQLAQMMNQMTTMQALLTQKLGQSTAQPHAPTSAPTSQKTPRVRRPPLPWDYCWSHGKCKHSSTVCTIRKAGHKEEATLANKLGGSTYGL